MLLRGLQIMLLTRKKSLHKKISFGKLIGVPWDFLFRVQGIDAHQLTIYLDIVFHGVKSVIVSTQNF